MPIENGRHLSGIVSELKGEAKDFVQTRIDMLKSEMKDKVASLKVAAVLIAGAAFLGITAWFVLTAALIAVIAVAFLPSSFAYFFATIIVGVAYALIAAVIGAFAIRELKQRGLTPVRTIRVLKQDQIWIQNEARQQAS